MREITLLDYIAIRLDIPRVELKDHAYKNAVHAELMGIPETLFSVSEWNIAFCYLYRENFYFSSVMRAKEYLDMRKEKDLKNSNGRICKQILKLSRAFGLPVILGLLVFVLMQSVFMICVVPSASMEPTIKEDSFILALRVHGSPQQGDIVVFAGENSLLVKRIVASYGDTVYINDKTGVYTLFPFSDATRELNVPSGHFFVVGDNLDNSFDARFWDEPFIGEKDIIAKVLFH